MLIEKFSYLFSFRYFFCILAEKNPIYAYKVCASNEKSKFKILYHTKIHWEADLSYEIRGKLLSGCLDPKFLLSYKYLIFPLSLDEKFLMKF